MNSQEKYDKEVEKELELHSRLTNGHTADYIPKLFGKYRAKEDGEVWIIMEYINGGSTGDLLLNTRQNTRLTINEV